MGTKIRLTALALAVCLTMNMVIMPVKAEDIAAQTESSEPTSPTTVSSEPTSPVTEPSEPTSPVTEPSEPGTGESMLFSTLTRAEPDVSEPLKALAKETAAPLPAGQEIEIHSGDELYFLAKNVKPKIYQNCVLNFVNNQNGFDVSDYDVFPGLGNADHPFGGQITFVEGSGSTEFKLKQPLFQCLYDSAQVKELKLHYAGTGNSQTALFAANVVGNSGSGNWSFTLQGDPDEADVICTPPLIGTIEAGSNVSLVVEDLINLPVEAAGKAGLLCGTLNGSLTLTSLSKTAPISVKATDGAAGGLVGEMGAGASLTVTLDPVDAVETSQPETLMIKDVSATGNAGGLVGKMAAGATLTINTNVEISGSVTTSGGDAGGLVGLAEHSTESLSTVTIKAVTDETSQTASNLTLSATAAISGTGSGGGLIGSATDIIFDGGLPTITGTGSISGANAGGLIGSYTYSGADGALSEVSQNISGITVNGSSNAGGVFGMLNNTSESGTFAISANTVSTTLATGAGSGNAGGLIGRYQAGNLAAALNVTSPSVSSTLSGNANAYGGLIGWISGGSAYVEVQNGVSVSAKGTAAYYGGLIGDMYDSKNTGSAHMVKIGGVSVTNSGKGTSASGGLVGRINAGAICLDGAKGVAPGYDNKAICGNVVGLRNNALVYTTASPWSFNENSLNDIGNWGQVLVASELPGLLDDTSLTHSVKVTELKSANTISDKVDFGAAALRFQLDSQGALVIPEGTDFTSPVTLTLSGTIDLGGTGLTGFQRDYYKKDDSSSVTEANVTLNGTENATIIFPDITVYTGGSHNRQGLFAKTNGLTVENVTLKDGRNEKNPTACGIRVSTYADNTYAGALVAESSGDVKLTNVSSDVNIEITSAKSGEIISGLIAYQNGGSVTFSGCEWDSDLTYSTTNGDNYLFAGGFLARAESKLDISVRGCSILGRILKSKGKLYGGGFIGSLYDKNNADVSYKLAINGLTVDGVEIAASGCTYTGGLLGYEWMNTTADISGITVKNSVFTGGSTSFGGLVYKGSGYWKLVDSGINFESGNTFTGKTTAAETSGLFVCHGDKLNGHFNALYLEILDGAYTISSGSVSLAIDGSEYFDEIIGQTEHEKGNGIVSIATTGDLIYKEEGEEGNKVKVRNTYEKQLTSDYKNGNTRYYYNLDSFRKKQSDSDALAPSGVINNEERMVLFSAYSHCFSGLRKYFYTNPGNITNPTGEGEVLNLTGYSYYPAEQYATVQNATIKFDFANIETREEGNKKPSDATRQHYGMHTGIFIGAFNQEATLNVSDLTLQGTVGGAGSNYGALIRDGASGLNANHMLTLKIGPVTLDGIRVIGNDAVKPLLINKLDSYTKLDISGVTMTDKYIDKTQKAASSLIGDVGNSTSGRDIQLTFSNMELNGKENESIFSRATFLESFQYANAGCSGVYNFEKPAIGTPYTLGKELSNTGGEGSRVSGRNNGRQYWFYNAEQIDENLVCGKKEDGSYNDPVTFFATGYLRYVYRAEGSQENYHEIDINLKAEELDGCGTYSDPYIIKGDGAVTLLKQFADAIKNSGASTMSMKIMMDPNVLGNTFKDEGKKTDNTHTCVQYQYEGGSWKRIDGSTEDIPTDPEVLNYLCNAYYKIDGEITIDDDGWAGLGTSDNPFSGVIVGAPGAKVTISKTGSQTQYGGLIKFSQGSVVKNLRIEYTGTPTVATNGVPTSNLNASFFGGVVGWCVGGDTIIDTVEVAYPNAGVTISGNNDHLTAVGGYVGMVGGAINDAEDKTREKYGGGVVFRKMTDDSALTGDKADKSSYYFYYNPYVGRVLDGYVMLEKPSEGASYVTSLNNTDKNYTIPTISAGTHLSIASGTVTVNNAQGLWLLSAIANSGAGAMQNSNCLAYNVGKPRTGTYDNVGGELKEDTGEWTDETYLGGKATNKTTSYLTAKYTTGYFHNLCFSTGVSIVLNSDCDMSSYGNGFRGIGASYATNANGDSNYRLIPVSSVASKTGETYTVTLGQDRKEYTEEKDNWTSIGSGLFVLLRVPSNGFTASNLNLSGKTGITYYEGTSIATANTTALSSTNKRNTDTDKRLSLVGVGMLVGNLARVDNNSQITLDSVHLLGTKDEKVTVNVNDDGSMGTTFAGGLAGYLWINSKSITNLTLRDCTYEHLSVRGRIEAGGFIGYTTAQEVSIEYTSAAELKDGTVKTTLNKCNQYDGVGGLIGEVNNGKLDINAAGTSSLTVRDLSVSASVNGTENNVGGLIGVLRAADAKACVLKNIHMEGKIELAGSLTTLPNVKSNVGLIAGGILDKDGSWNSAVTASYNFEVSNFRVAQENGSNVKLYRGWQIGGLIGLYRTGNKTNYGTLKLDDICFGSESSTISILNGTDIDGSHNCAASCLVATSCLVPQVEVTDVQIVNTKILSRKFGAFLYARIDNQSDATQTIDFKNISIENSTVAVSNGPSNNPNDSAESYYGIGALYGRIDNKGATITGCNILFRDCQIGFHVADDRRGKLAGITNDMPQTLNVGLSNSTASQKNMSYLCYDDISENERSNYTRGNIAIFGGSLANDTNKSVKLVGVSIQQEENTLPMKDFGTNPGSYYVVRADYKGYQDGNITGAKAPYVTTSPLSPLGTLGSSTITGDGASFVKDTTTPVGGQILENLKDPATNLNLKHPTALAYGETANGKKAYEYLLENSGKAFFGDFKQQGGNSDEDYTGGSFPVLTLVTNFSVEANELIYSWISLLTNRTINTSSEGVTITLNRYKWSASGWTTDDTEKLPLKFDNTNKTFSLNKGVYDSGQNRFTLLDVAFDDPADNTKDAYHLYIPVIVQKMLRFRFWASAQTGTTYIKSSYMEQNALAAASHGQQVTVLMGFEYKRTQADWQEAVDNGDNLLFGFEKSILLDGTSLPSDTHLTLVDCTNQNKAYYADGSAIVPVEGSDKNRLDFNEFTGWSAVYLCDMLNLSVVLDNNGQYYKLPEDADETTKKKATVRIRNNTGYDYYQYVGAEDTQPANSTGPYSVTVGWEGSNEEPRLREQYYLTIQTPAGETEIRNNQIICPSSLRSSKLPTLREKNDGGGDYTLRGYENRVLIGDFFDQNVTISTAANNNPEMSTVNHVIQATLTSEIKFSSPQSAETFKTYAKGQNLFQSFDLRMQKTEKAGEQAQRINLVPGTRITAEYFLGDTPVGTKTYTIARSTPSFRLDFPKGVDVGDWDEQNGATFKAKLTLEYPDAAILAQFPLINGDPGNLGVNLGTSSYLAYTKDALPTTTIHKDAKWDTQNFYRRDFKAASLNYYPVKRTVNSTVESVNQLGVNGWNQQNSLINSAATYDASALDGAGDAKTLRCTLSLKRKTADGGYEAVDGWEKYLAEGRAPTVSVHYNTSGVNAAVASPTFSGSVYTTQFTLTSYDKDVPIEIQVDMNVLTGAGFEAEGKKLTYANYKVEMCVELLDSTGTNVIAGSRAEDYIVYTNARINPNPIRE